MAVPITRVLICVLAVFNLTGCFDSTGGYETTDDFFTKVKGRTYLNDHGATISIDGDTSSLREDVPSTSFYAYVSKPEGNQHLLFNGQPACKLVLKGDAWQVANKPSLFGNTKRQYLKFRYTSVELVYLNDAVAEADPYGTKSVDYALQECHYRMVSYQKELYELKDRPINEVTADVLVFGQDDSLFPGDVDPEKADKTTASIQKYKVVK